MDILKKKTTITDFSEIAYAVKKGVEGVDSYVLSALF